MRLPKNKARVKGRRQRPSILAFVLGFDFLNRNLCSLIHCSIQIRAVFFFFSESEENRFLEKIELAAGGKKRQFSERRKG